MRLLPLLPLVILAAPLPKPQFDATVDYLYRFGYLSTDTPSLHELRTALKVFQDVAGLPVTGEVDEATLEVQRRPRCVHPDTKKVSNSRRKRFALAAQSKWDKSHFTKERELHLKWRVSDYTNDLSRKVVRSTINKAFQLWSTQANMKGLDKVTLVFEEVENPNEPVDIDIKWAEGDHGDTYTFDGSRTTIENILAHTFFPGHSQPLNGDIHFDDAEQWETDPEKMKDGDRRFFPYVLAHEIGHALGLQHSRKQDAVMNPYYSNTPLDELQLDVDDICGINWNYAGPSNFCLFVWLMSEIVPAQNNNSEFHNSISSSDHILPGEKRVYSARRILKNARIPRCTSSNGLKLFAEKKLHRNLQFPGDEARKYSEVVCNFLAGLHMYRGGPAYSPDDTLEKEYHGVNKEVSEFGSASSYSIRRLARQAEGSNSKSVFDPSYFDRAFFDGFLPQYLQYLE